MPYSQVQIEQLADELRRVVEAAFRRLSEVSDDEASVKASPSKWSFKEIVGHLIDSATNNHHRFVRARDDTVFSFPGYAQDGWVERQGYNDEDWDKLLGLWRMYNHHIAHLVVRIPENKLATECRIGTYEPHSLGFLVEDYVAHLKHHLKALP